MLESLKMWWQFIAVMSGGALGAALRYAVILATGERSHDAWPAATFIVNVLGCLLVGLLLGWLQDRPFELLRLFLIVGFMGALTTWSSFVVEIALFGRGHLGVSLLYSLASLFVSLMVFWLGWYVGGMLAK